MGIVLRYLSFKARHPAIDVVEHVGQFVAASCQNLLQVSIGDDNRIGRGGRVGGGHGYWARARRDVLDGRRHIAIIIRTVCNVLNTDGEEFGEEGVGAGVWGCTRSLGL